MSFITRVSQTLTITNVADAFAEPMQDGQRYKLVAIVTIWFSLGSSAADAISGAVPTGAGAVCVPAGTYFDLTSRGEDGWVGVIKEANTPIEQFANLILLEV